jgi:hypothetical protein
VIITEKTTLAELEIHAAKHGVVAIALGHLVLGGVAHHTATLEGASGFAVAGRGRTVAEAIAAAFEYLYMEIGKELAPAAIATSKRRDK